MLAEMVRVLPVDRWRRPCGTRRGRQARSPAAVKPNVILRAAFAKAAAHCWLAIFLAAFAWAGSVQAQTGPISFLVGYAAGGSADFVARVLAAELPAQLGRNVVVENAAGASGMIALQRLVNQPADTNRIYFGGFDTVAVPMVNPDAKIDWQKETLPVGRTTMTSMVLVVPKDAPYQDLAGPDRRGEGGAGQHQLRNAWECDRAAPGWRAPQRRRRDRAAARALSRRCPDHDRPDRRHAQLGSGSAVHRPAVPSSRTRSAHSRSSTRRVPRYCPTCRP